MKATDKKKDKKEEKTKNSLLTTDLPLAEKDEVKKAEAKQLKQHNSFK